MKRGSLKHQNRFQECFCDVLRDVDQNTRHMRFIVGIHGLNTERGLIKNSHEKGSNGEFGMIFDESTNVFDVQFRKMFFDIIVGEVTEKIPFGEDDWDWRDDGRVTFWREDGEEVLKVEDMLTEMV